MTVKCSVSLTDEQHTFAKSLVEAGSYPSVGAVLRQGVDLLRQKKSTEKLGTAALCALLSRRREGEFVSAEEMANRIARIVADKRRAHDVPT